MTEICPGRCNTRYRRVLAEHKQALGEWLAEAPARAGLLADWEQQLLGIDPPAPGTRRQPGREPEDRPEPPAVRPRYGEPLWCASCAATVRANLAELDPLRLEQSDGYQAPGDLSYERVSRSQDAPSPSPGHDDLDELMEWLRVWENAYRAAQRPPWPSAPYRGVSAPALTAATAWLGAHLDAMLAHGKIGEPFGIGVLWWHRRLQSSTSTQPPLTKKPIPCPRRGCGRYSLFFHDDARRPTVRCHADPDKCGLIMTVPEYDEYQAEYEQQRPAQVDG